MRPFDASSQHDAAKERLELLRSFLAEMAAANDPRIWMHVYDGAYRKESGWASPECQLLIQDSIKLEIARLEQQIKGSY